MGDRNQSWPSKIPREPESWRIFGLIESNWEDLWVLWSPRRRSWSLSSWEGELQLGGDNSKFRQLGSVKERSNNGSKWSRNYKSNFCLSTIYMQASYKMILGRPRMTREMQQVVFLLMQHLIHQMQPLHANLTQVMEFSCYKSLIIPWWWKGLKKKV